jgi:hypothetical protein
VILKAPETKLIFVLISNYKTKKGGNITEFVNSVATFEGYLL